jgi:hypothetical protein
MQTNVVSARIAAAIRKAGGEIRKASVTLTSGVGGRSYGVEGVMNVTVSLTSRILGARKQMCLRVLVCKDVTTDLIIGLPSIKHFDLLPILNDHITTIPCCEICSNVEVAAAASDTEKRRGTHIALDSAEKSDTFDKGGRRAERDSPNALQGGEAIPIQHSHYTGEMATLFAEINAVTDNFDRPTYSDPSELIQALQGLHLSEVLEFDDEKPRSPCKKISVPS